MTKQKCDLHESETCAVTGEKCQYNYDVDACPHAVQIDFVFCLDDEAWSKLKDASNGE